MNKQELIEKIKKAITDELSSGRYYRQFDSYGYIEYEPYTKDGAQSVADDIILDLQEELKQLDEPRKPVVPQFVAVWFEDNKDDLEFAIWKLTIDSNSNYTKNKNEMRHWIQYAPNKPYKTLIGMLNGYEVEKEPLYEVIIGDLYLIKKFNNRNDFCFDTSCSLCAWEKSAYQLTEAEIKEIDERFWPFAVPVEEVEAE